MFIKPDGVQRKKVGQIIRRLEDRGLKLIALKLMVASKELMEEHYAEHKGKGFFDPVVEYATSGPVVAMVLEGKEAIKVTRAMIGQT